MLKFAIVLLFSVVATACGKVEKTDESNNGFNSGNFPNVRGQIYGAWQQDKGVNSDGITERTRMYFNSQNQIGLVKVCSNFPESVEVDAIVPGQITTTDFAFTKDHAVSEKGTGPVKTCEIALKKSNVPYVVEFDKLYIKDATGETISFSRIVD